MKLNDLIEQQRREANEETIRYRDLKKLRRDLLALEKRGFSLRFAFDVSRDWKDQELLTITLQTDGKTYDEKEERIAGLAIEWDFPVKPFHYCPTEGGVHFQWESFRPVVLPKSGIKVKLVLSCGSSFPPGIHVSVQRHRTWSTRSSYSCYCTR